MYILTSAFNTEAVIDLDRASTLWPISLPGWDICKLIHLNTHAVLYRATNKHGKQAVIKRFGFCTKHLSDEHIQDFIAAVDTIRAVSFGGLVEIFNVGLANDHFYLLMEHLKGGTLADKIAQYYCYPLEQRLDWFEDIVIALGTIHNAGVLHGDLKASNIMFRAAADDELVLVDCGIENQWLIDVGYMDAGEVYCTPYYVSPERAAGEPCDEQADIYSLGVIFYELMTGEKPYVSGSMIDLIKMHALAPIPQLPEESACYQYVLDKMLAKFAEDRYLSLDTLLDDIYFAMPSEKKSK